MLDDEYFKVSEVTALLKVTRQAVYNWIAEGKLRAVKVGGAIRIPRSALEPFIKPVEPSEIKPENADGQKPTAQAGGLAP